MGDSDTNVQSNNTRVHIKCSGEIYDDSGRGLLQSYTLFPLFFPVSLCLLFPYSHHPCGRCQTTLLPVESVGL